MNSNLNKYLYNIFPEIFYVVDRNSTPSWRLDNTMGTHNLMLIYDGKAALSCNGHSFEAEKGDLVYFKPGDLRKAHTFPNNLMKCYAADFTYTCPVMDGTKWELIQCDLPFSVVEKINDEFLLTRLSDLFGRLTRTALSSKEGNKLKERMLFTDIMTLLFHYKEGNQYNYSNVRKIEKVINYMTERYTTNITLKELADFAQISPSYLVSIFKKVTGKSSIDYLIEIRINKAKDLLGDGYSVSETAKLVGFSDVFYFSRAFKKHEGVTPSQYKDSI